MIGFIMAFVCVLCALVNIPGMAEGYPISYWAFGFCMLMAVFNMAMGVLA